MREKIERWCRKALAAATSIANGVLAVLDWMVKVVERSIVIGVASAILYVGFCFVVQRNSAYDDLLSKLDQHWKALLILLVPLFYRPIRTFLDEVQEIYGLKRQAKEFLTVEPPEESRSKASAPCQ